MSKYKKKIDRIICELPFAFYFAVLTVIAIARAFDLIDMRANAIDIVTVSTFVYALICFPKHFRMLIEKLGKHVIKSIKLSYFVVLLLICLITSSVFCAFNLSLSDNVEDCLCVFSFALLIIETTKSNTKDDETHNSYKLLSVLGLALLGLFLVIGVPLIINECYKANCGYITVWDGADVLGYYGTILGAAIAVLTLVATIVFTKKQIQRDSYLRVETEKLSKLESIFLGILDSINPIETLKNVMDNGFSDPTKAINILQKYQLNCKTANDRLNAHLNMTDYPKFKVIIDTIANIAEEFVSISQGEIDQYSNLRLWAHRETASKMLHNEEIMPGSFSPKEIEFSKNQGRELR